MALKTTRRKSSMAESLIMDCGPSTIAFPAASQTKLASDIEAAKMLSICIDARQFNDAIIRFSEGNLLRRSSESVRWSCKSSPLTSPLPAHLSPASLYSSCGSSRTLISSPADKSTELLQLRSNLICNWLHQKQLQNQWSIGEKYEGVILRKNKNEYICCPTELKNCSDGFHHALTQMNVKCAMTVNTGTTRMMLDHSADPFVYLNNGLRLQVLPDFSSLLKCHKGQFSAFIKVPPVLVVWDDDPAAIVDRIQDIEGQIMDLVWNGQALGVEESVRSAITTPRTTQPTVYPGESRTEIVYTRETVLIQSLIVAAALLIMCLALGAGWKNIAIEYKVQNNWSCFILPVVGPIQAWLGLFFFQTLPTCLAQIFGPVRQMKTNSKFFSGRKTRRLSGPILPHVTVQCPVYKESLHLVIQPTIKSIKAAITTYEMQGGTANIFVNDDGMQVISADDARERRDFYEEHNIGWVARPRHNFTALNSTKVFRRAGKFKKASNMNYALNVSIRIEEKLAQLQRLDFWTTEQEFAAYYEAMAQTLIEDKGRTWACGNIRIGDYILLIDSDTRVPRDCLLDAVSELEHSPEVAIVQFSSSVLNITQSWFEKGITFFTNMVYTAIEYAVANGDVAPFVGHNAFLRWSAVQDVAYPAKDDPSYEMFWSEETVSEDFDMALRLQTSGYTLRLAAYAKDEFKEGVSLTVYDELARWEKYAYGCSELIFNPLAQWTFRGPFTPLFRRFIFSNMPLHSKFSIIAYVGTYFAIASSWLLTLLNYFLIGWFNGYLDHYYMESFKIYFSVFLVFNFIGNIALAILRYRIDEEKLLPALLKNFKWVLLLTTFLGGMSLHLSQAILCHLFSINMTWGATGKEATSTSFFLEIPVILRKFRFTFTISFVLSAVMVVLSGIGPFQDVVPYHWQITQFTAIVPLALTVAAHALLPLALNPGLMQFTF